MRRSGSAPKTCYMCEGIATSVEHVPAQCFFPERKDLPPGIDLRRNLFTVPSCDGHNSHKSQDDQYLWQIITATRGINECGERMVSTKVSRSISRRPALIQSLARTAVPIHIYDSYSGAWDSTAKVRFDGDRLLRILEQFGRALYFHHFRCKWRDRVASFPNFIDFDSNVARDFRRDWRNVIEQSASEMAELERIGENQDAFYYKAKPPDSRPATIMSATFYGAASITIGFYPNDDQEREG